MKWIAGICVNSKMMTPTTDKQKSTSAIFFMELPVMDASGILKHSPHGEVKA